MAAVLWPRIARLGRRLLAGRQIPIVEVATATWTLAPAETTRIPPAVFLDGQLSRIVALSPWRTEEAEQTSIHGGIAYHAPSLVHRLQDATLAGSHLYCGPAKMRCGPREEAWFRRSPWVRKASAHLVGTFASTGWFANFVLDELALDLALPADADRVSAIPNTFGHAAGYRRTLGIEKPDALPMAHFDELHVYQDFAQHSHKVGRYRQLRERLRARLGKHGKHRHRGVFLDRGHSGESRLLANHDEVLNCFRDAGFLVLDPADLDAEQLLGALLDAPIVAGVEGSHLSHGVYTVADGGSFLVLQPPDRFAMTFKEYTDCMDMRFGFVVGSPATNGFSVAPSDLLATVAMLEH